MKSSRLKQMAAACAAGVLFAGSAVVAAGNTVQTIAPKRAVSAASPAFAEGEVIVRYKSGVGEHSSR